MKSRNGSVKAVVTAAVAAVSFGVLAGVMDDCTMLFHGGSDYNGNGCFDDGELRDRLHPGTATDVVKKAWDFPSDCITWTNMDVQCNCKSNVLKNQTCLYFHQKGTVNNVLTDKACALELPRFGYSAEDVNSAAYAANFTMLIRLKLPAADTKADGTALTSGTATLAAIGNCGTSGSWMGTDAYITRATSCVNQQVQNWSSGKDWTNDNLPLTNAVYTTRDAEWVEIAVVSETGSFQGNPSPNIRCHVWRWDGSTQTKAQGGRNGSPCVDWPTLLGNNAGQKMAQGFQGAVHMVAFWKRTLSEAKCKEAFQFMSGNMDSLAHDGNNSGLFKFGYDTHDGRYFGGPTGGETTLTAPNRYATDFPSNFTAGTKLTIQLPLDAYTKNMKQVLRLRTAANSATGTLSVKANDVVLAAAEAVAPSKTYCYYLPESFFANNTFTAELTCTAAGAGGIRLATAEVAGSWTIGLKDKSTTEIIPGQKSTSKSSIRTFSVGIDPSTSFQHYWYDYDKNRYRSYTDIKFYVPEGVDRDYKFVFKGSVYGGGLDPTYGAPHDYTLNGTKKSERFFFVNCYDNKDYAMTIEAGELTNGWNTIHCQNYITNTMDAAGNVTVWRYTYWDYVTLQIVKQTNRGMMILVR